MDELTKKKTELVIRLGDTTLEALAIHPPRELEKALPFAMLREIAEAPAYLLQRRISMYGDDIRRYWQEGVIRDTNLDDALKEHAGFASRELYDGIIKNDDRWPDTVYPEYIAYALMEDGILTENEKLALKFDHGENIATFCQSEGKPDFIGYLKDKLLNPE
jgi:hypothetical protein